MKIITLPLIISSLVVSGCAVQLKPFTQEENQARVLQDISALFQDQEPITAPLTLNDAIARALKYNLDHRLKLMEDAVAMGQLDVANINLLPAVVANLGARVRNNADSTFNEDKTLTSTSSDRDARTADLSVSWNVLDFAIGYVRAHQQADMALMVQERRRSVIHSIVNDTRRAYWRAVAAERALQGLEPMLRETHKALNQAQVRIDELVGAPLDALTYQQDLLLTIRELETRHRQLVEARTELAVLLNTHPGTPFTLADATVAPTAVMGLELPINTQDLELIALQNRSELRAEAYQLRLNQREAKVALLEMIPGLNFTTGINYTSDSFKVNSDWYDASLNLSWNIMNLFKGPTRQRLVETKTELSNVRRLALSMAVISQVNIAQLRFQHARADYELTNRLASVQDQIAQRLTAGTQAKTVGEARRIQGEVSALLSNLQRDMAYADMQSAFGSIFASIGADPLPTEVEDDSIEALSLAVGAVQDQWRQGHYASPEPVRID